MRPQRNTSSQDKPYAPRAGCSGSLGPTQSGVHGVEGHGETKTAVSVYVYCEYFCALCGFKDVYLPVCIYISEALCFVVCLPVPPNTRSCVRV